MWAKDGSELFYVDGEGTMIAARIGASVDEPVEDRLELFQASRFMMAADHAGYDVDSEGHRFLMLQEVGDDWTESRVSWVLNFADEVERLVSN